MGLASSVQRKILNLTPRLWLEILCRKRPKFAIELLCYWINELTVIHESGIERALVERQPMILPVVKKMSQLSTLAILNLLKQDESLWKLYMPGAGFVNLKPLPYILLEIMYDLGGSEGRQKVLEIASKVRVTLGGQKQGEMFENFKAATVIDLFEQLPAMEVKMRLQFSSPRAVAFWLDFWDREMQRLDQPMKSAYWLGQIPGERAYEIELLMKQLEFRKKFESYGGLYEYKNEWKEFKT
jgi:hypothetical protein